MCAVASPLAILRPNRCRADRNWTSCCWGAGLELKADEAGNYRRPTPPGLVSSGTSYPGRLPATNGSKHPVETPDGGSVAATASLSGGGVYPRRFLRE